MTDMLTPDSLRPGSVVGPWLIEGYAGRGTYGGVYRARRVGHPGAVPVALKLAVFAYDPRFLREAEMLSRLQHPAVPQLVGRGWWIAGPKAAHPYLVLEWISGLPLYEWGREYQATSRQALRVLAQVAEALAVLHQTEGLHRDVKGGNILVEPEGRAVLTDYGSSTWAGAPPITESLMPPNTRQYRSPEALRFEWTNWRNQGARYEARPADDLYALGVSMYQLVTRVYPPPGTAPEELKEQLQAPAPQRWPAQALNGRVVPELSALIERLLAREPEARGSASEVAEAAEAAAEHAGPEADVPLFGTERPKARTQAVRAGAAPRSGSEQTAAQARMADRTVRARPRTASWAWRSWLVAAALVLVVIGLQWAAPGMHEGAPEVARAETRGPAVAPDSGTKGLGDSTLPAPGAARRAPIAAISQDVPKKPLPGQRRPPCRRGEAVIHGSCWRRLANIEPPCGEADAYQWQGSCYDPALDPARQPTSEKPE